MIKKNLKGQPVAVLPFTLEGNINEVYAETSQEIFMTQMIKDNYFTVTERANLKLITDELHLQNNDEFDSDNAVEIGKLTGAVYVISGSITEIQNQLVITVRGIDVATGVAVFAERDTVSSQSEILTSVEKIARTISSSLKPRISTNLPGFTNSETVFIQNNFYKWKLKTDDPIPVLHKRNAFIAGGTVMIMLGMAIIGGGGIAMGFADAVHNATGNSDAYYGMIVAGIFAGIFPGLAVMICSACPYYTAYCLHGIYNTIRKNKFTTFLMQSSLSVSYNYKDKQLGRYVSTRI